MKSIKSRWKVGDWMFCEFKLQQIAEMRDGHVQSVTDGWFVQGTLNMDDRCFPLTLKIKCISDNFRCQSDKLHQEGNRQLNFPDIHRWLVKKWCEVCRAASDDAVKKGIEELDKWARDILNRSEELKREIVGGIPLFRP